MTAISIAEKSTQAWEDTALGSESFDTPISEERLRERRLYETTPGLETLANAEWDTLQKWVAFKMAVPFADQLYKQKELNLDLEVAIDEYIIPELRTRRAQYLSESAYILGTNVPQIRERIEQYSEEKQHLESGIANAQELISKGDLSPILPLQVRSWESTVRSKRRDINGLEKDISKQLLSAKLDDAMFYKVTDYLKFASTEEANSDNEAIVFAAKMLAYHQVINSLKSERAGTIGHDEEDEDEVIVRGYDRRIETLEIELRALEEVTPSEHGSLENVSEIKTLTTPEKAPSTLEKMREFRRRLIGKLGVGLAVRTAD